MLSLKLPLLGGSDEGMASGCWALTRREKPIVSMLNGQFLLFRFLRMQSRQPRHKMHAEAHVLPWPEKKNGHYDYA